MLFQCHDEKWTRHVQDYIGDDYASVPYFYVDLLKYGISDPQVRLWADQESGRCIGAYLLYYDCLHFFTREERYPSGQFFRMLQDTDPRVAIVQTAFGDLVENGLSQVYAAEKMHIVDLRVERHKRPVVGVELATEEDLEPIADMMLTDPVFKDVYERDVLLEQLHSRYRDGFSRYFVIRDGEKIAAAYSSYGETKRLTLLSGLIVHPNYRGMGLGKRIMEHAFYLLAEDGVQGLSLINYENTPSIQLHKRMGGEFISSLTKFVKR